MKKLLLVLMALCLLVIAGCALDSAGTGKKSGKSPTEAGGDFLTEENGESPTGVGGKSPTEESGKSPEVKDEPGDVTITLTGEMIDQEDISEAKKKGVAVTENDDGTVTYRMSRAVHSEMLQEIEEDFYEMVTELKEDSEYGIKDIQHSKGFSKIAVTLDRGKYEDTGGMILFSLSFFAIYYQNFEGAEKISVEIEVKDAATGKVFETFHFPE